MGQQLRKRSRTPNAALYSASAAQAAMSYFALGLPAIGPELRDHYGLSLPQLGIVLTAVFVGSGLSFLPVGRAIARFGAQQVTFVGTLVAVIGLCGAAVSPSSGTLVVLLVVGGAGMGVLPIAGGAAVFGAFAPSRRGWAMGIRQMSAPLGGMIAALTMPALVSVGGVELALLVGATTVGATGVLLALYSDTAVVTRRSPAPMRAIWRTPGVRKLLIMSCFFVASLQAVLSYTVPSIRDFGFSAVAAGVTYFVVNATSMISRVAFGKRADRAHGGRRRRTLVETGLVTAVGAIMFIAVLNLGVAAALPFGVVVVTLGASGWNAIAYTYAGELTRPELATLAFALTATVVFLATGIVTPLLGALAAREGWNVVWLATAAFGLGGAAVARCLPRTGAVAEGSAGIVPVSPSAS